MIAEPARQARHRQAGGSSSDEFARDLAAALAEQPRRIPSRYLYDELGSALFEAIGRLPWYSISRAESGLLRRHATDVFRSAGPIAEIIEVGGGSGAKVLTLVVAGRRTPGALDVHLVDVSAAALSDASHALTRMDGIRVVTHETTYDSAFEQFSRDRRPGRRRMVLLLGSILGNLDFRAAAQLLARVRGTLDPGQALLLGVDLLKPERRMLLAYDDPLGVNAALNRNLLVRMNRELGAGIDLDAFAYRAVWNAALARVERHLVSRHDQRLWVPAANVDVRLLADEAIVTGLSYKYELSGLAALLMQARFRRRDQWVDQAEGYTLTLAEAT